MDTFDSLPDSARVWIYQASRPFSDREIVVLNSQIGGFVQDWTAHQQALRARGAVVQQQFVVLAVDEAVSGASGCSIDKSVHFLENLEKQFDVDLFDRLKIVFMNAENQPEMATKSEFLARYTGGGASGATLVFDNTVQTLGEWRNEWLKPLQSSWHWRFLGLHKAAVH